LPTSCKACVSNVWGWHSPNYADETIWSYWYFPCLNLYLPISKLVKNVWFTEAIAHRAFPREVWHPHTPRDGHVSSYHSIWFSNLLLFIVVIMQSFTLIEHILYLWPNCQKIMNIIDKDFHDWSMKGNEILLNSFQTETLST